MYRFDISLGYKEPDELEITLATILGNIIEEEEFDPRAGILHHEEGVDLIPANIELSGLEVAMINVISRESIMKGCHWDVAIGIASRDYWSCNCFGAGGY